MAMVTDEYVKSLEPIYREVLRAFGMFNPNARPEWGIAPQSLYSVLNEKGYAVGEIREACQQMVEGKALTVEKGIFYKPTPVGQEMINRLQLLEKPAPAKVPPFSPPPAS
jgi:hypothetical protein